MDDYTQAQQKYAGTGENCNIVLDVILNQVKKIYKSFGEYIFYQYYMVLSTLSRYLKFISFFFVCEKLKYQNIIYIKFEKVLFTG